jgi:hypothetical protein
MTELVQSRGRNTVAGWLRTVRGCGLDTVSAACRGDRSWGSTEDERTAPMPGDDIIGDGFGAVNRAITIDAPPAHVWDWLVRLGFRRPGGYTRRRLRTLEWRIDNHYAAGLLDLSGELAQGDMIADGVPRNSFFWVLEVRRARELVLYSSSHIPARLGRLLWADWTWSFRLEPIQGGAATRLLTRSRPTGSPAIRPVWHLLLVPGDCVMARRMLRGIKRLSERTSGAPQRNAGSSPRVEGVAALDRSCWPGPMARGAGPSCPDAAARCGRRWKRDHVSHVIAAESGNSPAAARSGRPGPGGLGAQSAAVAQGVAAG